MKHANYIDTFLYRLCFGRNHELLHHSIDNNTVIQTCCQFIWFSYNVYYFAWSKLECFSFGGPHNTELLITNVYIPPASSCNGCYSPPLDHMLTCTDSLVLGDFNAHHSLWHSGTTDTRGNQLADSVSISSFAVINTNSPTMLPGNADPSSPDVSLAPASLITSSEWQTYTTKSSDNCHLISCPAQNLHQPQEGWLDPLQARDRTQTELPSSSNWLPERREVIPNDTIEGCFPSPLVDVSFTRNKSQQSS